MNTFNITFKYSEDTYCSNIVIADNEEIAKKHYTDKGYEVVGLSVASEYDIEDAKRRGKPIVTVETADDVDPEEKPYDELVNDALEILADDEIFADCVEALDGENGFADGYRCVPMSEIDDFYYGVPASKLLNDMTKDFNIRDDFFYYSIYGLESTDDRIALYKDNTNKGEVFDNLLQEYKNGRFDVEYISADLDEILTELANR